MKCLLWLNYVRVYIQLLLLWYTIGVESKLPVIMLWSYVAAYVNAPTTHTYAVFQFERNDQGAIKSFVTLVQCIHVNTRTALMTLMTI